MINYVGFNKEVAKAEFNQKEMLKLPVGLAVVAGIAAI